MDAYYDAFVNADSSYGSVFVEYGDLGISVWNEDPMNTMGYQFVDLNKDGICELFIGTLDETNQEITDGYWYSKGKANALTDHMNKESLGICGDVIIHEYSYAYGSGSRSYNKLAKDGSGLVLIETVSVDSTSGAPFRTHLDSMNNQRVITEEEAEKIYAKYEHEFIELIPFKDYAQYR